MRDPDARLTGRTGGWLPPRSARAVAALGVLELGALAALGWWPPGRQTPSPSLVLFACAFLAYVISGTLQSRAPLPRHWVWGLGLTARVVFLPLLPFFSDDVYRYMWDGWVQLQGLNPFVSPPADELLAPIRTSWHSLINHPSVSTIYPPGAQLVFRALAIIGPTVIVFKLAWLACDMAIAAVIDRLTRDRADGLALLLYLWSPLLIVEVAWSAHLEPVAILPVVLAVWFDRRAQTGLTAGALLGLGASLKLAPAAAFPVVWRRHGWKAVLVGLAVPLLLYLAYAEAGPMLFGGLREYAARWEFNAGVYRLLVWTLGSITLAKLAGAAVVAGISLEAARRSWPLDRALLWIVGAALLLSPTVHPWYVVWILPFAALRQARSWIAFTGLVFLAYWGLGAYLNEGVWRQPGWVPWAVYLPVYLLLASDALRPKRFAGGGQVPGGQEEGEGSRAAPGRQQ